jgi:hypothetical protein
VHGPSHYSLLIFALAAIFGAIGVLHLLGPRFLREAYERWDYGQRLRLITGFLEILAAIWLANPDTRAWGIGLAATINFGGVLTLLHHRQYLQALPGIAIMTAFLPATLAIPPAPFPIRFITVAETVTAQQPAIAAKPATIPQKNTVSPRTMLTVTSSSESGRRMVSNLE